jgi:hypothetical protein
MSAAEAQNVVDRYVPGQPMSLGANHAAELIEAHLVLSGSSLARIHTMREALLGAGVND